MLSTGSTQEDRILFPRDRKIVDFDVKDHHKQTNWEHSRSVVEFLTLDLGVAGLSLTGVTVLCP